MADDAWKLPWTGHCRCERVAIAISVPPLLTMACHCKGCQRMTGSAFSLSVAIPNPGFEVTVGTPVRGGTQLDSAPEHFHCPHCKSWLFTKLPGLDFTNVRASMLDDRMWYRPFVECVTSEKLPFVGDLGAPHAFPVLPTEMGAWAPIVADFAARGASWLRS